MNLSITIIYIAVYNLTMLFSLLGSGEFTPWTEDIDRELVAKSINPQGTVLIFPTASAPEGDKVFNRWGNMGLEHFKRLGLKAEIVNLKTAKDLDNDGIVDQINQASLVYFSGGNPAYLSKLFSGSKFWESLLKAVQGGVSFAGCSAGANMLGARVFDNTVNELSEKLLATKGLGLYQTAVFCPHWDAMDKYMPGSTQFMIDSFEDYKMVGIDEDTAMVGDGINFKVHGKGQVQLLEMFTTQAYKPGQSLVI